MGTRATSYITREVLGPGASAGSASVGLLGPGFEQVRDFLGERSEVTRKSNWGSEDKLTGVEAAEAYSRDMDNSFPVSSRIEIEPVMEETLKCSISVRRCARNYDEKAVNGRLLAQYTTEFDYEDI